MSTYTEKLPQSVTQKWRNFAADGAFTLGLDWLRHNAAPAITGETPVEKFECAVAWKAYMQALDDIEDRLTALPKNEQSLDEPPLKP